VTALTDDSPPLAVDPLDSPELLDPLDVEAPDSLDRVDSLEAVVPSLVEAVVDDSPEPLDSAAFPDSAALAELAALAAFAAFEAAAARALAALAALVEALGLDVRAVRRCAAASRAGS
jgi:hypothetical protein